MTETATEKRHPSAKEKNRSCVNDVAACNYEDALSFDGNDRVEKIFSSRKNEESIM